MSAEPEFSHAFEAGAELRPDRLTPQELFVIGFTYFRGNWNQGGVEIGQDIEKAADYLMAAYGPRIGNPENVPFEPFHDHTERMLRNIRDMANSRIKRSLLQRGLVSEFEESSRREENVKQALAETDLVHRVSRFLLTLPPRDAGAKLILKDVQPSA
ncbi:MAG: hypothetical protein H6853_07330 [Rhodospirillales bacterium]|nr:hypothetical protein [Alphaproteobacteria bacterium]USO03339.1 MAG: hypothetical protein H6853_07330 [Rhodospirillales bacterium]